MRNNVVFSASKIAHGTGLIGYDLIVIKLSPESSGKLSIFDTRTMSASDCVVEAIGNELHVRKCRYQDHGSTIVRRIRQYLNVEPIQNNANPLLVSYEFNDDDMMYLKMQGIL